MGINEQSTRECLSELYTRLKTLNVMSLKIIVDIPQIDTKGNRLNPDLSPTWGNRIKMPLPIVAGMPCRSWVTPIMAILSHTRGIGGPADLSPFQTVIWILLRATSENGGLLDLLIGLLQNARAMFDHVSLRCTVYRSIYKCSKDKLRFHKLLGADEPPYWCLMPPVSSLKWNQVISCCQPGVCIISLQ